MFRSFLAARHEQKGGYAVDHNANRSHGHDGETADRLGINQTPNAFPRNAAGHDQQYNRVAESGKNRGTAQAISETSAGQSLAEN